MKTRFVIVAAARTGSHRLVSQLTAQPDVWCHGEIHQLERCWITGPAPEWNKIHSEIERELLVLRNRNLPAFYDRVYALSHGRQHVGFKALFGKNNNVELTKYAIRDGSSAKIILFRQNALAVYASRRAAIQSNAWNPWEMRKVVRPKVEFLEGKFERFRNWYASVYRDTEEALAESGQNSFVLRYEEINNPTRLSQLLGFIGAKADVAEISTPDIRGSSDILSRFSNPEVAEAYLREHGLMHWAHEGDVSL